MDLFLIITAILCAIIGLLGAILPVLPGPPLSLFGLLLAQWSGYAHFSSTFLWIFALITGIVTILDYVTPIWMTKRFGGSASATNGSLIGLLAGLFFFPPFGMIIGPFVGAFIGELIEKRDTVHAFRIASLSFSAFLLGTGLKLIVSGIMLYYIFISLF